MKKVLRFSIKLTKSQRLIPGYRVLRAFEYSGAKSIGDRMKVWKKIYNLEINPACLKDICSLRSVVPLKKFSCRRQRLHHGAFSGCQLRIQTQVFDLDQGLGLASPRGQVNKGGYRRWKTPFKIKFKSSVPFSNEALNPPLLAVRTLEFRQFDCFFISSTWDTTLGTRFEVGRALGVNNRLRIDRMGIPACAVFVHNNMLTIRII